MTSPFCRNSILQVVPVLMSITVHISLFLRAKSSRSLIYWSPRGLARPEVAQSAGPWPNCWRNTEIWTSFTPSIFSLHTPRELEVLSLNHHKEPKTETLKHWASVAFFFFQMNMILSAHVEQVNHCFLGVSREKKPKYWSLWRRKWGSFGQSEAALGKAGSSNLLRRILE